MWDLLDSGRCVKAETGAQLSPESSLSMQDVKDKLVAFLAAQDLLSCSPAQPVLGPGPSISSKAEVEALGLLRRMQGGRGQSRQLSSKKRLAEGQLQLPSWVVSL